MLFSRKKPDPQRLLDQFFARFAGKYLVLHAGFEGNWLEELIKQPGGAGYFRLDLRQMERKRPSPLEWVVQQYIEPHGLPLPLFALVREDTLLLRHLRRGSQAVHPSEILWFLDEIEPRHHLKLTLKGASLEATPGIPPEDNEPLSMLSL